MKYKIGDVKEILQNKDFEVFAHGCNLQGAFQAGIAGVVRSAYPECYEEYMKGINSGEYEGGQMIPYEIAKDYYDKDGYCWDSFEDYLVTNPDKELSTKALEFIQSFTFDNYDEFELKLRIEFPKEDRLFFNKEKALNKVILNAFTQIHPGPDGSYDLVDKVFKTISKVYDAKISFPLIGCGIAGLEWSIVKEIIDYRLKGKDYECIVRAEDVINYKLGEASLVLYDELKFAWDEADQGQGFKVLDEDWRHFKEGTSMFLVDEWFAETFNTPDVTYY